MRILAYTLLLLSCRKQLCEGLQFPGSHPIRPQIDQEEAQHPSRDDAGQLNRRSFISGISSGLLISGSATAATVDSSITPRKDYYWPYWGALPVFPFAYRRTLKRQVASKVWTFDQLIGIYYVQTPIRMTVIAMESGGLLVYAPVALTPECRRLLQPIMDEYGPIRYIILPTVAVEHKVLAGPFARAFPQAEFYTTDQQYSFPLNLPDRTLGLPSWSKPLPKSSDGTNLWNGEFEHEVLTVKPGIGSMYQDVAMVHKPSGTLLVCDALFATTENPPDIFTEIPEYTTALLFHARDSPSEIVPDTLENRQKGWRRIVLLFNFFFPNYSAKADLGVGPLLKLDPSYPLGWAGWMPFEWIAPNDKDIRAFERYNANGKPTIYTIVQIILSRGDSGKATLEWVDRVKQWKFDKVIPAHLDAPLAIGPKEFSETYDFIRKGENRVRYCDEDVAFLRAAEEGPLKFSVYPSNLGVLRGDPCTTTTN